MRRPLFNVDAMLKPNEPITPIEIIPGAGCGYRGFFFGSFAVDGECVDETIRPLYKPGSGFGLRADSAPIPCPFCDPRGYVEWLKPVAFQKGYETAAAGLPVDGCPFPTRAAFRRTGNALRIHWLAGWLAYVELHGERGSEVPVRGAACLEAAA